MDEQDNKPAQEPKGGPPLGADDADVRVAIEIEQTRQALEASAAEIERSKRLLRETEELGPQPVPPPANSNDDGEPS
jgi:hypothetical protein